MNKNKNTKKEKISTKRDSIYKIGLAVLGVLAAFGFISDGVSKNAEIVLSNSNDLSIAVEKCALTDEGKVILSFESVECLKENGVESDLTDIVNAVKELKK